VKETLKRWLRAAAPWLLIFCIFYTITGILVPIVDWLLP
jgi:hypothetical protein